MKLYNIYESIILEESKTILTENVREKILSAMKDRFEVRFEYRDKKGGVTQRYGQIHDFGKSTSDGNPEFISVWQKGGQTAKTKDDNTEYGWKQFLLNRIVDGTFEITKMRYHKPISDIPSWVKGELNPDTGRHKGDYNPNGNKNMIGTPIKVF